MKHEDFLKEAIRLSKEAIDNKCGGPFGCVIVKNGEIVGKGFNRVLVNNDPTAHAEVTAIRDACEKLNTYQLEGCVLYTSCEPCPMCLSAIYWARIQEVYFANTCHDAARIGFDDAFIYHEIPLPYGQRKIKMIAMDNHDAQKVFDEYDQLPEKLIY